MAEEKKAEGRNYFAEVLIFLGILYFIILLIPRLNYLLYNTSLYGFWQGIVDFFKNHFWPFLKVLDLLIVGAAILFIAYVWINFKKLHKEENKIFTEPAAEPEKDAAKNDKWERVLTHINSSSSSDWRLAIIESDVILEEALRAKGYTGDTLGELLKGIDKSDLLTLDNAWDAHKVRNLIAHAGGDYYLTEREAKRVISLYESVFKELKVI